MRLFYLVRKEDVSGVSGCGTIAEGCQFDDEQVALSWLGQYHSIEIHPSIEQVVKVHGHEGRTVIEWVENLDGTGI